MRVTHFFVTEMIETWKILEHKYAKAGETSVIIAKMRKTVGKQTITLLFFLVGPYRTHAHCRRKPIEEPILTIGPRRPGLGPRKSKHTTPLVT